ncbi:MAG: ABC transporter permease subunit, partial [Pseudomonadota bacterium]
MGAIAAFEWRFQRRGLLFWSLGSVFFLLSFLAMAVEQVQIGAASASMDLNASWVIVQTHLVLGILGMFAAIAFVAGAITRDYEAGTAELLFSTGVSARQFVLGRFLGGLLAALVVMVLAVLGTFLASLMPWLDPERVGPLRLDAYAFTLAVVTVPSTIIICGLFFVTAAWTRSVVWSYVAALALLVGYVTLGNLAEPEDLARYAWLDPFGIIPFGEQTRYWTTFERNDELPVLSGSLLWGRVLWCTIACAAVLITAFSYRLRLPQRGGRRPAAAAAPPVLTDGLRPVTPGPVSAFAALRSQLRMDVGALLRSTPFYVLLAFGLFNAVGGMLTGLSPLYGTPNYPLTRLLIDIISGTFSLVLLLVLVYYAGELVHREREARVKLLLDATPYPNGIMILSKLLALWFVLYAMLAVVGLTAVFVQLSKGYAHFEFDLYLKGLFGREAIDYLILAAIAVVIQCFASGKFLGMMATLAFFIFTAFLPELGVEHHLATFTTPAAPYSDLNGFGHFATPLLAYSAYWLLICGLLILVAHLFYERGIAAPFGDRRRQAALRIRSSGVRLGATTGLALTALLGGWIYYNTNILNEFTSSDKQERLQADYEKDYGGDRKPNPVSFRTLSLDVDLYPEQRRLAVTGRGELVNLSDEPITKLLLNVDTRFEYAQLTLAGAELAEDDALLGVRRYRFADPWLPGEQRLAEWAFDWRNPGFRDSGSSVRLVANGTFIDSQQLLPLPGYQSDLELADNNVRRRYDLPPVQRLPPLDDPLWRKAGAFGVRGRAAFDVRITTAADQIAVAPGYLVSDTITEPGRRRFEYRMDKPIWPFVSISSARYAVAERDSDGLKLQVFYHPDHDANIDVMLDGAADSLAYFSAAFGPYQHRQFRILEFPGYRSFAQSFPNTIPYS